MKMKHSVFCIVAWSLTLATAHAHSDADHGVTHLDHNRRPKERVHIQIPDIEGYQTLKCDFHMHTVFSDGLVWPSIRVQEAWQEGLDAIAITDHMEYLPHKSDVNTDHNRSYELAKDYADRSNVLLIQGTEITRYTPPGHFNAIFINDASGFMETREKQNLELDKEAIERAATQDAFIFWNHPGWKVKKYPESYTWSPFLQNLLEEGKIHGIEVINGFGFHRWALDWALDNKLTVMGTSDIHNLIEHDYDMDRGVTRTMNLIFVKERSVEGIREALEQQRTVAWASNIMAGAEKWVRSLYDSSVSVSEVYYEGKKSVSIEISNNSDFVWEFELVDETQKGLPTRFVLNAHTSRILDVDSDHRNSSAKYRIVNAFVRSDKNLIVDLKIK